MCYGKIMGCFGTDIAKIRNGIEIPKAFVVENDMVNEEK